MNDIKNQIQKNNRNTALDGFRGLGCILVLLGHTQWNKGTILPGAVVSMDLFFVMSGFLITNLLLNEFYKTDNIDLLQFWKRRAIRLLPAFYVYFLFGLAFYLITKFQPVVGSNPLVTLLSTAFYGSNWAVAKGYDLGVFTVTWSLSLEEQFYFLCPIFFLISLKYLKKKQVLYLLGIGIILVNFHRYHLFQQIKLESGVLRAWKRCFFALDTRCDSLMIGCFFSIFYSLYKEKIKISGLIAGISLLIYFIGVGVRDLPVAYHISESSFFTEFLVSFGFSFFSIIGAIIVMHLMQNTNSFVAKLFSIPALVKIGLMSYSIYLWHTTIFGGLEIVLKNFNQTPILWIVKTLIRFSVAFLIGYLSFKYIEMPVNKYLNKKRKFQSIN